MNYNTQTLDASNFDAYHPDHIALFAAIYGKHLISLGGLAAIDNMFSDINIQGLKTLDVGFGLGGVAFYLAEKYQMQVAGIEVNPWMVQYAKDNAPTELKHLLEFNTYDNAGKIPYQPETFDLVYSKGVFNHITDKISLFKQIYTVLKPNGLLIIADWIFPEASIETTVPLVCETEVTYQHALNQAGFTDISFRDDSQLFIEYTQQLLINLANHHEFIKDKYGEAVYLTIEQQHEELIEKIKQQQKMAVRIVARKKF